MRRCISLIGLAWLAVAQSGPDREKPARELLSNAAQALAARDGAGFLDAFDQPLAAKLRKPVESLIAGYEIQPAIEFLSATAGDRGVDLSLDWKLDLTAHEGQRGITHRTRRFQCRIEPRGNRLRIVSFDGPDMPGFFAPPKVDGAWDLLLWTARALSQDPRSFGHGASVTVAGFMACFDSKMPGREDLRAGAEGLIATGEADSTLELKSDEGTDTARTLIVDWTLEVVNPTTQIRIWQREADLTFRVERRGKDWVIVAVTPLDLFTK